MTTNADQVELLIEYEAAVPTLGGPDAADFQIRRPGHATLECALYLALDAKQAIEAICGPLSDDQTQSLLRVLADDYYRAVISGGVEPPAIWTIRARELSTEQIDTAIDSAGLTRLPIDE